MAKSQVRAKTPREIRLLRESNELDELKRALGIIYSWGIHDPEYMPELGMLLYHKDPEVLRFTLGIMLHYELYGAKQFFLQFKEHVPVLQQLASTQFTALELIVALCGPSLDLVPCLRNYLHRFPEEACDLVVKFGPIAKQLVPDLIEVLQLDDWDTVWAAADATASIGPAARKAVPVLKRLLKHKSGVVTGSVSVALESITGIPRDRWPRGPDAGD
jgi:hypothetical protein